MPTSEVMLCPICLILCIVAVIIRILCEIRGSGGGGGVQAFPNGWSGE